MIKSIKINNFLNSKSNLEWNLNPTVNILAGVNGSGKSVLIGRMINIFTNQNIDENVVFGEASMEFDKDSNILPYRSYMEYWNISKWQECENSELFANIIDNFFASTGKRINRNNTSKLTFLDRNNDELLITRLSKGEKLIISLFYNFLVKSNKRCIILIDCVDSILHTNWQEKLIDNLLLLNPNTQIIIATHSPYILGLKWSSPEYVFQMEELLTK